MMLCCLRRNVDWLLVINISSSSLVKHKRRRLLATNVHRSWVYCTWQSNRSQHAMEPDIGWESHTHLHSTPPLGGPRRDIATTFGVDKLEWMIWLLEDMFIRFDEIHERDRQTDRHTDTAWRHRPRLHSIARQKWHSSCGPSCVNEWLCDYGILCAWYSNYSE